MTKRMLVDAAYPEETRVVVADNDTLLDFDFETTHKRQLKGNIYLAKVIRVEPSLQAAFVDYGGNRHGFLAFSEIHPDYYQIPQADRDRLNELEAQLARSRSDDDEDVEPVDADPDAPAAAQTVSNDGDAEQADLAHQLRRERGKLLRSYKIQEVVRRRQIMLIQVVKEERGTKGAALTTYLSLAGRYCVLMPNTAKGGGISRKIATQSDRTRLKKIAADLDVPEGMGLIIRTAGQERTKAEIRRDYDYLLRLWSDIRERTLTSIAPCAIHEEADLIRRAMRDLYSNDVEEILVEGEAGYKTAKAFMTMLMPSRARRVKQYKAATPVFFAFKVEDQLDKMHNATVTLRSGGSIVIHTTEALTAIDVNSGRATRERHIDDTAVKTNLEAADEIARQLRLRDIAGLVVIDFIDMAEHRHQRQVEKRIRDALKVDRARLQIGRISAFGLLELSRQRLRPSFLELSTQPCSVCHGTGFIRSIESASLQALRRIEALGVEGKASKIAAVLPVEVALYLLNQKRVDVQRIEERYGLEVLVRVDDQLVASEFRVDILETDRPPADASEEEAKSAPATETAVEQATPDEPATTEASADDSRAEAAPGDDGSRRKRRRRRRPRRRSDVDVVEAAGDEATGVDADDVSQDDAGAEIPPAVDAPAVLEPAALDLAASPVASEQPASAAAEDGEEAKPKRRRRRRKPTAEADIEAAAEGAAMPAPDPSPALPEPVFAMHLEPEAPADADVAGQTFLVLPEPPGIEANYAVAEPEPEAVVATPEAVPVEAATSDAPEVARDAAAMVEIAPEPQPDPEPQPVARLEPAPEPAPEPALEPAGANGHAEPVHEVALADRPGVVVDDAAVSSAPRRQGWWSRWTKSDGEA